MVTPLTFYIIFPKHKFFIEICKVGEGEYDAECLHPCDTNQSVYNYLELTPVPAGMITRFFQDITKHEVFVFGFGYSSHICINEKHDDTYS